MPSDPTQLLERRLDDARGELERRFADVDITAAVLVRVAAPVRVRPRVRVGFAMAATALLVLAVTLIVPPARHAVARWLGIAEGVIEIRYEPFPVDLPPPP